MRKERGAARGEPEQGNRGSGASDGGTPSTLRRRPANRKTARRAAAQTRRCRPSCIAPLKPMRHHPRQYGCACGGKGQIRTGERYDPAVSSMSFSEGETAFDVLQRACSLAGIQLSTPGRRDLTAITLRGLTNSMKWIAKRIRLDVSGERLVPELRLFRLSLCRTGTPSCGITPVKLWRRSGCGAGE